MKARYPSFSGLKAATEASSRTKQQNRSKGTQHEILLRRAIRKLGLRYRVDVQNLPGKPDLVFWGPRVAVFCDGDFWHGREWEKLRAKLLTRHNAEYWEAKIASNRKRDQRITEQLQEDGWAVVRVWEGDILKSSERIAQEILETVMSRRKSRVSHRTPVKASF